MRTIIALFIVFYLPFAGFSQSRILPAKNLRDLTIHEHHTPATVNEFKQIPNPYVKSGNIEVEEVQIGDTRYDNQSNASIPKKMYLYPDGTIAATWTRAMITWGWPGFEDRGAGYNYFDGTNWGDWPLERIEDVKTHRPTYAPLGENGELIVSHISFEGLYLSSREEKGTGDWEYESFPGPSGNPFILWNRTVTSGTNRNRIHILALTFPTSHGGEAYAGLDGALLYSLSTDGGNSWSMENEILPDMSSNEYYGFTDDNYAFAEPKGDVIAFTVGDTWYDLFLMKSTDGGETFEKTIIWNHPYPFFNPNSPVITDTFYCADGSHSLVIDNNDMVHVAFGISRIYSDDETTYNTFPFVDGIGYWNEDMEVFSNNVNALSTVGDPDSELEEDYNLIGWSQDVDGNGELDFTGELGNYWLGLSSMPQLIIDDEDRMFLVYSSVTETYDNGLQNYRHIWGRASSDGGESWGLFTDITSAAIHSIDECVYPAVSATSDNYIYLLYQTDYDPGTAAWGSQHVYNENRIMFAKVSKQDLLITNINENQPPINDYDVFQNYPNPFNTYTEVKVNLRKPVDLHLHITNLAGQKVYETLITNAKPGMNNFTIDGSRLTPGLYFYTVKAGESIVSKKMIVK